MIKTSDGVNMLGVDSNVSPGVMLSPNGTRSVPRQRQRSNKGSSDSTQEEEEPQTKERINAILEMAQKEQEANKKLHPLTTVISHSQASTIIASLPSSSAGAASVAKTLITPVTLAGAPTSITIPAGTSEPKSAPHVPVAVTPQMQKTFGGLIQPVPANTLVQVKK